MPPIFSLFFFAEKKSDKANRNSRRNVENGMLFQKYRGKTDEQHKYCDKDGFSGRIKSFCVQCGKPHGSGTYCVFRRKNVGVRINGI